MSRKGNCYDNVVAESFFRLLKTEWVNHHHRYLHPRHAEKPDGGGYPPGQPSCRGAVFPIGSPGVIIRGYWNRKWIEVAFTGIMRKRWISKPSKITLNRDILHVETHPSLAASVSCASRWMYS